MNDRATIAYRDGHANGRAAWIKNCADRANDYLVEVLRVKDPAPGMGDLDLGFIDGVRFEQGPSGVDHV